MPVLSRHWFISSLPLWLYIVLYKTGGSLYYTALPVLGERILPLWLVGCLIGAASLLQLMLDVPAGFALDRFGYTRLLRLTSFILSLGGLVLVLFGLQTWTFLLLILISGLGWLLFGPGVDAYALAIAPRVRAGRFIGMRRSMSSLGVVLATGLFTILLPTSNRFMGMVILGLLASATLVAFFLKKEPSTKNEIKVDTHHYYIHRTFLKETLRAFRRLNPASGLLAFSGFAGAIFYGIIWFVLPLYLQQLVTAAGPIQYGLAIFDVTVIICGGLIGRLADSRYKKFFVFIGLFVFAAFSTLVGFHLNGWFLLFGFIAAVGDELSCVSLWSWMNELNPSHAQNGIIASVIALAQDLGWVIGPVLAGVAYFRIGPSWTILLGASFIAVSWIISTIVLQRHTGSLFYRPFALTDNPPHYPHKD